MVTTSTKLRSALITTLAATAILATTPAGAVEKTHETAGAAPLGSVTYPTSGVVHHINPNAAPGGDGSTPEKARQKIAGAYYAQEGDTIVLHGGTYNEYVGIFNTDSKSLDGLTIQAAPGDEVWLDGSLPVTDWTTDGGTWTAPWETHRDFNTVAGFGDTDEVGALSFVGEQNPMAADPSQVFVDGVQLQQVATNPGPGQFAMDHEAGRIILGQDPAGTEVRASYLSQAIVSTNVRDLTIRGIGIRGYATPLNWMGTVYLGAPGATVQNIVLDSLPTIPLFLSGTHDALVENVTSIDGGLTGLSARHVDGGMFRNLYVTGANQQRFNAAPTAGGFKLGQMRDFTIKDSVFENTHGATGLWVDESGINFVLANNVITGSGSSGIHVEIGACSAITGNILTGNAGSGIEALGNPHTYIANNYIADNGEDGRANISVLQDGRRQADGGMGIDSRYPEPSDLNTWVTTDMHVVNNVLGAPSAGAQGHFDIHDREGTYYADVMMTDISGNVLADGKLGRFGTQGHRIVNHDTLTEAQDARTFFGANTVQSAATMADMPEQVFDLGSAQCDLPEIPAMPFDVAQAPEPEPTTDPEPEATPSPEPPVVEPPKTPQVANNATAYDAATGQAEYSTRIPAQSGDTVLYGDWDGDGVQTPAVRTAGTNVFSLADDPGSTSTREVAYGKAGEPVYVGDWDGDGTDTLGIRRGNSFHLKNTIAGGDADIVTDYGKASDQVHIGDWNGDGTDTPGVRRGNVFHLKDDFAGGDADIVTAYGRPNDTVLIGDWDRDGVDTPTIRRGAEYHVANSFAGGNADVVFTAGGKKDAAYAAGNQIILHRN